MNKRKVNLKKKQNKESLFVKNKWLSASFFIAGLVFIFYSQTFNFEFVNWDDDVNVYENQNVVNFDVNGIFKEHVIGNYNPLSNLSFAIEYQLVKNDPRLYHINNVLLHIICTLLVFFLMKRLGMSFLVSIITALLFGIHPMRVESVAWITERKDVLFGTLYLSSLLLYISFYKTRKGIYYIFSLLVFALSLLSKIQAVSLPFSLLLIDFWFEKKLSFKLIINKLPFFLLSLITGLVGIYFLRQQGSLDVGNSLPVFQRLFIGSYSYMAYIIKSIFPYQMSALYPFPTNLTLLYYVSIIPVLIILISSVLAYKTKKLFTFGILFFTLNIVFVLQVVGAGQGFTADRFTYIPYIGLFLIYAVFFENLVNKFQHKKTLFYSALSIYLIFISILTVKQIKVWENSETLWTDVINKAPTATLAYNNLGHYYRQNNEPEKALKNYNIAIDLAPQKARTYNNRGKIFFDKGEHDKALEDYNKSLSVDPDFSDALANRGAVYGVKKEYDKAIEDFSKALEVDPGNFTALSNRGFAYYQLKEYDKAIEDFKLYLRIKPNDVDIINTLGLCFTNLNNFDLAIMEYNKAIQIAPSNAKFYANRSQAYYLKGENKNALEDALTARRLGFNVNPSYLEMLNKQ